MFTLIFPALAAIIKALCVCSSLYILFSPVTMWVYLGICILSGMEDAWVKRHRKSKIYT